MFGFSFNLNLGNIGVGGFNPETGENPNNLGSNLEIRGFPVTLDPSNINTQIQNINDITKFENLLKSDINNLSVNDLNFLVNFDVGYYIWYKAKEAFNNLDYKTLSSIGLTDIGYILYMLEDPSNRLWSYADAVANGKSPEMMKTMLKDNLADFYAKATGKTITSALVLIGTISTTNPITGVIGVAISIITSIANFGSIHARQRSADSERHLDTYRKLVPSFKISDKAKAVFHENIQKLRAQRPKCKSLTDACTKEHVRYSFISDTFRDFIDKYNDFNTKLFSNYNFKNFTDTLVSYGIDTKQLFEYPLSIQMKAKQRLIKAMKNDDIYKYKKDFDKTSKHSDNFIETLIKTINDLINSIFSGFKNKTDQ